MKKLILTFMFLGYIILYPGIVPAQSIADFSVPDTAIVGQPVTITNLTTGGSSFYWNFSSGYTNEDPMGVNLGNPGGVLDIPTYPFLVKQGNDCFMFVSCQATGIVRYYLGSSFRNDPVSWTVLGKLGKIWFDEEGIQIVSDNGLWYGFVNSDSTIIRLDFGTSLLNIPAATDIGPFPTFNLAHDIKILKEGDTWIGIVTNGFGNSLVRLIFGPSLTNQPVIQDMGNFGVLTAPTSINLYKKDSTWYLFLIAGNNTMARFTFGTSLLNIPTGVNLGNPGGFDLPISFFLIRDCDPVRGFWVNYLEPGEYGKITFNTGILGSLTGQLLGNIGELSRPHSFSQVFRENDTLFVYVTNRGDGTLSRWIFPPSPNPPAPASTLVNPAPVIFTTPGIYTIHMIVNEGMLDQTAVCKTIKILRFPNAIENKSGQELSIYPNPAFDYFVIRIKDLKGTSEVFIRDALGRTLIIDKLKNKIGETEKRFSVTDLQKGSYFIELVLPDQTSIRRVLLLK